MVIGLRGLSRLVVIVPLIAACAPRGSNFIGAGFLYSQSSDASDSSTTKVAVVSTLAGSGVSGSTNGTGTQATFNYPYGVAADTSGNLYVGDTSNHLIRKITPSGVVTTLAGTAGVSGSTNGTGTQASFNYPQGVTVDVSGNIYVADGENHLIRKITFE